MKCDNCGEVKTDSVADYIERNLTSLKSDYSDGIW